MGLNTLHRTLPTLAAAAALSAAAGVHAAIFEDFQFNDANGTPLAAAVNSANPGNFMFEDTADMPPSAVQDGVYRINKANLELGHNFLDIDDVTSGVRYLVMDIAGWNLIPDFESEEVWLSFLDNTTIPGGSTRTADIRFSMIIPGVFRLDGSALGNLATSPAGFVDFGTTRTTPLSVALKLDKDNNTYELLYKDNTDPWASLGVGNIGERAAGVFRDGNTLRFRANNDFGAPGEFFDVDRIYLTDVDPTTSVQLVGDLNGDGFVGIGDLNIVLGVWNQNVTPGSLPAGDPTGDGFVGIGDLNVVLGNWNAGTPPGASADGAAVPEPGALVLLAVAGIALANRRS